MAEESAGQMVTHQGGEQDTVVKQNMEAKAAEMLAEEVLQHLSVVFILSSLDSELYRKRFCERKELK